MAGETYQFTITSMVGAPVRISTSGSTLIAHREDAPTDASPCRTQLHHAILGVYPVSTGDSASAGLVYVHVDGPEPLLQVDALCRSYTPVLKAATQEPFMQRWKSDTELTHLATSHTGCHIAVGVSDGRLALYSLYHNEGKPYFQTVANWCIPHGSSIKSLEVGSSEDTVVATLLYSSRAVPSCKHCGAPQCCDGGNVDADAPYTMTFSASSPTTSS